MTKRGDVAYNDLRFVIQQPSRHGSLATQRKVKSRQVSLPEGSKTKGGKKTFFSKISACFRAQSNRRDVEKTKKYMDICKEEVRKSADKCAADELDYTVAFNNATFGFEQARSRLDVFSGNDARLKGHRDALTLARTNLEKHQKSEPPKTKRLIDTQAKLWKMPEKEHVRAEANALAAQFHKP